MRALSSFQQQNLGLTNTLQKSSKNKLQTLKKLKTVPETKSSLNLQHKVRTGQHHSQRERNSDNSWPQPSPAWFWHTQMAHREEYPWDETGPSWQMPQEISWATQYSANT